MRKLLEGKLSGNVPDDEFEPVPDPRIKAIVLCAACGYIAKRWLVCPTDTFEFRSDCSRPEHGHYRCQKCKHEFALTAIGEGWK